MQLQSITPTRTQHDEYWAGFQKRADEEFLGVQVNVSALTPTERRGYRAASNAQADTDTATYLAQHDAGPGIEDDHQFLRNWMGN